MRFRDTHKDPYAVMLFGFFDLETICALQCIAAFRHEEWSE
jgi:hypothetical protein